MLESVYKYNHLTPLNLFLFLRIKAHTIKLHGLIFSEQLFISISMNDYLGVQTIEMFEKLATFEGVKLIAVTL